MPVPTSPKPPSAPSPYPFYVTARNSLLQVGVIQVRDADHWRHLQAMGIEFVPVPAPSLDA